MGANHYKRHMESTTNYNSLTSAELKELAKQRELTFEQDELFSEIHVVLRQDSVIN